MIVVYVNFKTVSMRQEINVLVRVIVRMIDNSLENLTQNLVIVFTETNKQTHSIYFRPWLQYSAQGKQKITNAYQSRLIVGRVVNVETQDFPL